MKRLIIMRHAKSSWPEGTADHQRPLNKRGRKNAPLIAAELSNQNWIPDLVISSDACRTQETWQLMAEQFDDAPKAIFLNELYLAGIHEINEVVLQAGDQYSTILLLGHNPGWERATSLLCGIDVMFTTANAALLHAPADNWEASLSSHGKWRLEEVLRPKEID